MTETTETRVRDVLKKCEANGADPVVHLMRMKLLWTHEAVLKVRQDTLKAAADYFEEMSTSALPYEASTSALDMRNFMIKSLRELARRQADVTEDKKKKVR